MIDTHCHLNFSRFNDRFADVITDAKQVGVTTIIVPGTDLTSSIKGVEIANEFEGVYAAVGIHPHHVYEFIIQNSEFRIESELLEIENLLSNAKVVALGEVGLDRHEYGGTKYKNYTVDNRFIEIQKTLLVEQIEFAVRHKKSLILHNREAGADMLPLLSEHWDAVLGDRTVFHCCEPDEVLLSFAKEHNMFIGVDGDITYSPEKQEFVKRIPRDYLVLETDSPFLLPEPLRAEKKYPNEPKNLVIICNFIADILGVAEKELGKLTEENSKRLFHLPD